MILFLLPFCLHCGCAVAQDQQAARLLVWQNAASGDVVWWKVDARGTIISRNQGTGWGLVSDRHKVPQGWKLVGTYPSGALRILIWHNPGKGLVAYWRITPDGRLAGVDDTGWGLVSPELRVGSNWQLTDVRKVGENEVLFWRNLVNGMVAFWRLNTDNTLLDNVKGSGWGYVAEGVDLSKGWVLGGVTEIGAETTMIWRNEAAGQVAFWRINAQSCTLEDTLKGSGWGLVSDTVKVAAVWKLRAVVVVEGRPMLLWQNGKTGAIAYWKLTGEGLLADAAQGSGWGLVRMDSGLVDGAIFAGATVINERIVFFLQQPESGAVYHVSLDPSNPALFQPAGSGAEDDAAQAQAASCAHGLVAEDLRMDASWTLRVIVNSTD